MLGMIAEMIYGVPGMQAVMLGFGEAMFTLLRRYLKPSSHYNTVQKFHCRVYKVIITG